MENVSDALIMAFGFMIFVLALSISISSFGQARSTAEYIFNLIDRENDYMYVESADVNRKVSVENIIPTMYRAYKENYKIVFLNEDGSPFPIYKSIAGNNSLTPIQINTLDLEGESTRNEKWIGTQSEIVRFLDSLISGNEINEYYQEEYPEGLYKKLQSYKVQNPDRYITEHLGEYYQEDLEYVAGVSEEKLDINKTKKRIITYVIH